MEKAFTIQDYESLCPGVNRRSLQRDLSDLIEKGIIAQEGVKKAARYRLNRVDLSFTTFYDTFCDTNRPISAIKRYSVTRISLVFWC